MGQEATDAFCILYTDSYMYVTNFGENNAAIIGCYKHNKNYRNKMAESTVIKYQIIFMWSYWFDKCNKNHQIKCTPFIRPSIYQSPYELWRS